MNNNQMIDCLTPINARIILSLMTTKQREKATGSLRPRIAIITNHGYAGVEIPVGGAPDTGGQNFYVNSLARSLGDLGMEVTIFARGGFPFFESRRVRENTEQLTDHVRYVYVPGGGNEFLRKEDIAIALDEEVKWLARFICEEAREAHVDPWAYFECINTHYWDAAVMGCKLQERWRDQVAYEFLGETAGGLLRPFLTPFEGEERHRLSLSREIEIFLDRLASQAFPEDTTETMLTKLLGNTPIPKDATVPSSGTAQSYRAIERSCLTGRILADNLVVNGKTLRDIFREIDTHVWTPHSIGIIKERNFWNKPEETVRKLKFTERNAHEESVCRNTPLYCSTSPEIWRALVSYHGVDPCAVFDFPPCINHEVFRPRNDDETADAYTYLSEQSGISIVDLRAGLIVFETSRMDRTKRKDLLLGSFATVAHRLDNVYLFIGGGPANSETFAHLKDLKKSLPALEGRAFLLGFIPNEVIAPIFSIADLFVSASEMEGFGMSMSQAAAAQVAVVSSDLIPFATQYAKNAALVVKAGDVDGFAEAMELLLTDDMERRRRAKLLKEIADEMDWKVTASGFLKWFRSHRS